MNNRYPRHIGDFIPVVFLFGLALIPLSCRDSLDFSKVDDPAKVSIRNDNTCKLVVIGQVLDARTMAPIVNADIQLFEDGVISGVDGMYYFEVKDVFDEIDIKRILYARKAGYEMDTYEFTPSEWVDESDCEGSTSYVCVDFVLSPKNKPVIVQPNTETKLFIRDTSLYLTEGPEGQQIDTIITVLELTIPSGAVDNPTAISLSSYSRSSYLAALPQWTPMKLPLVRFRISSNPMITLKQPFTVRFVSEHPVALQPGDSLSVYRTHDSNVPFIGYDLSSNRWQKPNDAFVAYHPPSQSIGVQSTSLGSYMVVNESYDITFIEHIQTAAESSLLTYSNCNCGEASLFNVDIAIDGRMKYNLANSPNMMMIHKLVYLNDLKILTNTPFSSLITLMQNQGIDNYNPFIPGPDKKFKEKFLLGKCEDFYITARKIAQTASGAQYGQEYNLDRSIGVQVFTRRLKCPTYSPCHQGCP